MTVLLIANASSIHTQRAVRYLHEGGWHVHVASFQRHHIPDAEFHLIPTFKLGKLGYFFGILELRMLASRVRPEIFHAHHVTSNGFIATIARVRPLVISAWGSDVLVAPEVSAIGRFFVKYALKRADAVVAEAEHVRAKAVSLGSAESRTHVVSFGVNLAAFRFRSERREAIGPLRLISTRNHLPVYDVGTFLNALGHLQKAFSNFTATIAGDGPMRKELEILAAKLRLRDKVTFVGRVAEEQLGTLLATADIFVSTSLSDGENISLNEAMACGCFPIASAIPANAVIRNGENGLLFLPGDADSLADALEEAIRLRAQWRKIAATNRDSIERGSNSNNWLRNIEDVYKEAARARGNKVLK